MDRQYTLKSRQTVFERELKSLKSFMYGGAVYVWPYMADEAGKYSESQTVKFIAQLLDGLPGGSICADRLSFYKNMLYCVLRTMTSGYTEYHMGNIAGFGDPQRVTFSCVLSGFEDDSMELLENNTVYFMKTLYEIFTGKKPDLDCLHTEWEMEKITEEMRKAMDEEADARTAMEDELSGMWGFDMEAIRKEEQSELVQSKLQEAREKERLRETFADQEHFCRSLDEICVYLEKNSVDPIRLQADMQEMICSFLWDRGLTVFHDEEAFISVMVQLKKTIRTAQRFAGE